MANALSSRDVVLIGAGHTNMHVVRMWRMAPIADARLTLISPFSRATYSGMLPGTLAGLYSSAEMEIDLYRFAAASGVQVIIDDVVNLDVPERTVLLRERPPIRFDVASIGIGSIPAGVERWRDSEVFLPIKPMATFLRRLEDRLSQLSQRPDGNADRQIDILVVGGGAAGFEVTLCLDAFLENRAVARRIRLVDSNSAILRGYSSGTLRLAKRELHQRSIDTVTSAEVVDLSGQQVNLADGRSIPADIVIWATGAAPPPLIRQINLPKAEDGFLAVRLTLQSIADVPVFVVGDSATLIDHPVKKAGVFAVREGPLLWENLQRYLRGAELRRYEPQSGFLSLLADGRGEAFLDYKGLSVKSQWAWKLKDYIDRKFMRMYQDYRPMPAVQDMNRGGAALPVMRCRGCGGKAAAHVLRAALDRVAQTHPELASQRALDAAEDAAILDPERVAADLITVDFFQAFLDDPWLVGRVAALNALSDIWAMGGRPFAAAAIVSLPQGPYRQQVEQLFQLLLGSLKELMAVGVELVGGHTTESETLTVGFTVLGSLDHQPPLKKSGLRPGDHLVLTKPLGTGALLAGLPQARTKAEWTDAMLAGMLQSNATAATLARRYRASAMTDVTGFGLAGHLLEMLESSQVSAELRLSSIPLLAGFRELAALGIESTLAPSNRDTAQRLQSDEAAATQRAEYAALFDPQTSGGLLIGAAQQDAMLLTDELRNAGFQATVIGQVVLSKHPPAIRIVDG